MSPTDDEYLPRPKTIEEAMSTICKNVTDIRRFSTSWERLEEPFKKIKRSSVVADIGMGIGRYAKVLLPRVKTYYGIEPSPEMRKFAKDYIGTFPENLKLILNIEQVPSNCVDFSWSIYVLQHLGRATRLAYLSEIERVLKVGGIFYSKDGLNIRKDLSPKEWKDELSKRFRIKIIRELHIPPLGYYEIVSEKVK